MKKRGNIQKLTSFFLVFVMLLGMFIPIETVFAAGSANGNITSLTVSPKDIHDGGQVQVRVEFSEAGRKLQGGDTIEIDWTRNSDLYLEGYNSTIDIKDQKSNKIIGKLVVHEARATITFDNVVNNIHDISGWAQFDVLARNLANTSEKNTRTAYVNAGNYKESVNITKSESGVESVFYYKTGRNDTKETDRLYWWLSINNDKKYVEEDVKIEDQIQDGHELVSNSFEITIRDHLNQIRTMKGPDALDEFMRQFPGSSIKVNGKNISVIINKDYINTKHIDIFYKTKITDPTKEWFDNHSQAWYKEWNKLRVEGKSFNHKVQKVHTDAGATGTVKGELKVTKTIDGTNIGIQGVDFQLKREDGEEIQNGEKLVTLTTGSDGIASIKNLPIGTYKLKEIKAPEWIDFDPLTAQELQFSVNDSDTTGVELGVTNKKKVISIHGSKTWNDHENQDRKRPQSIIVRLLANDVEKEVKEVKESDGWTWEFTNLEEYDHNGNKIIYTLTEDKVEGYSTEIKGYDITNSYTPGKTSVQVTKAWKDKENQDGKRPESVVIKLLADGEHTQKTVTLTEKNQWTGSFTELDEYKAGRRIEYTVEEVEVAGYETAITGDAKTGYTITNTHEPEKIEIKGSKTWQDKENQDAKRPKAITIRLLANGKETAVKEVKGEDWNWKFENLDKYSNGKEIIYTLTEDKVEGYSTEIKGYDITNSYTPGSTSVQVTKAWEDKNDQDGKRPESVTIKLLADGEETGKTLTLTKADNWTGTFT
ncbi:TPA: Cna B-type domain-containing protein, partial [Streptococcus suis]|nr:Cna B-type domain-containing protein [Streptococcus suis]